MSAVRYEAVEKRFELVAAVFALLVQRHLVRGLTLGAVK